MNWRKIVCWLVGHKWQVIEGERTCTKCDHETGEDVKFCPKCGSERVMLCIMVSDGYQYVECRKCSHLFQDTSETAITVTHDHGCYELERPEVDQDGNPIGWEPE